MDDERTIEDELSSIFDDNEYRRMSYVFFEQNPFFYDRNSNWWLWNEKTFCYEIIDEIDLLVSFDRQFPSIQTEKSHIRNTLISSLKKQGRKSIPKDSKSTWIQFFDKCIDVETGEEFSSSPEFFFTNPILWKLGNSIDTPIIDDLFSSWVIGGVQDESYVSTLTEICSYCLLPSYRINRLFCLIGDGLNGKTTFTKFLHKFLGRHNTTSSTLNSLYSNRFESSKLYKKLLCEIDEIDSSILKKTSFLKSLTGDGFIRCEIKHQKGFDFTNYSKIIMCSNKLPDTTDKSKGFFRRWCIVDFPNTFDERRNVLSEIPNEEFENFGRKCISVLRELLSRGTFQNEGTIEERKERYKDRSSNVELWIEENCEIGNVELWESNDSLYNDYKRFCIENGYSVKNTIEFHRKLVSLGFGVERKTFGGIQQRGKNGICLSTL